MSRFSEKRLAQDLAKVVESRLPSRRRTDLAIILIGIGIGSFGNFYFGKVEVGAIFLAVAIFALGDLICSWWSLTKTKRVVFDIGFVAVAMAAFWPWLSVEYRHQHSALTQGRLAARYSFKDVKPGTHVIEGPIGVKWIGDDTQHEPFVIAHDAIRIDRDIDRSVVLSLVVRDRRGDLIADIKNNTWHVYQGSSDKNYSSDALEVLDARGRVVLQVQLLKNGIRLGLESYDEQGGSFRLGSGPPDTISDPGFHRNDAITPWFQYGSWDHWGDPSQVGERAMAEPLS